jgi:hypothetical protein
MMNVGGIPALTRVRVLRRSSVTWKISAGFGAGARSPKLSSLDGNITVSEDVVMVTPAPR